MFWDFFSSSGNQYRDNSGDCSIKGCPVGECIRQGNEYVCRQGKSFLLLPILSLLTMIRLNYKYIPLKCHPYFLSDFFVVLFF